MVIANGGYNTKQSIGIYGSKPPKTPWGTRDDSKIQESILEKILPEPIEKAKGQLIVEGYSIIYNRLGEPKRGIMIGTLKNGGRALAIIQDGSEMLTNLETQELIGRSVKIQYDSTADRNIVLSME